MTHGVDAPTHVSGGGTPVETWTVLRMILWSAEYLESKGVKSARLDAEHLLAHVADGTCACRHLLVASGEELVEGLRGPMAILG